MSKVTPFHRIVALWTAVAVRLGRLAFTKTKTRDLLFGI
ncbi:hypothetical protein HMPREF9012_1482 [Bacteroidetes bacterium oral taxon 272 str. F0290]|nr:hypothetical protein HMPREF9012_1482 [Bacteroidetes bacterium oral taxon 272 str. F0290]